MRLARAAALDQLYLAAERARLICGKKSRFRAPTGVPGCTGRPAAATLSLESFQTRSETLIKKRRAITTGVDEVTSNSIAYLPATYTTLFLLAASLLLGLMR